MVCLMVEAVSGKAVPWKILPDHPQLNRMGIRVGQARPTRTYRVLYEANRVMDAALVGGTSTLGLLTMDFSGLAAFIGATLLGTAGYAVSRLSTKLNTAAQTYTYFGKTQGLMNETAERILLRGELPKLLPGQEQHNVDRIYSVPRDGITSLAVGGIVFCALSLSMNACDKPNKVLGHLWTNLSHFYILFFSGLMAFRMISARIMEKLDYGQAPVIEMGAKVKYKWREEHESVSNDEYGGGHTITYSYHVNFVRADGSSYTVTDEDLYNKVEKGQKAKFYYGIGTSSGQSRVFGIQYDVRK